MINIIYMRQKILYSILLLFSMLCIQAQTTYQNPIIRGMNPDPSICRVGDDYYLVTSTFEYYPGLPIYQSKDLVNWKMIGYVLTSPTQNPLMGCESSTGGLYAPTIRYYNNTFYVVCTNYGGQGSQGSFYVTAKSPLGPWSEPHWVDNWGCDPSLLFANDSVYYTFPSDQGTFMQTTLNLSTGKFNSKPRVIAKGQGGSSPEGPHLYKIKDYYYLMSAEGGTGFQHREVIQRSKSPWGPFEPNPLNPIITHMNNPENPFHAIGHADIVETPDGWWLVCLGIRPIDGYHHLGRETFMAPVKWTSDGWPRVGQGIVKKEYNSPKLPQHIWPKESTIDNFDSTSLRLAWNFVRNPHSANWSLTEKPGFLRLHGSAISFKEKDSPAFICRRQTAFDIVASTKIDFTPTANNEEAGIVVRGNDLNHFDLLVTMKDGKRVAIVRKHLRDKDTTIAMKEISNDNVILRVTATELEYKFWVQEEGKPAVLIDSAETYTISTEKIWGFTGTYIGLYASGNGKAVTNPADFDWFEFEENPTIPYNWLQNTNFK
jgi:xylan 1,4-beta-xylosidase